MAADLDMHSLILSSNPQEHAVRILALLALLALLVLLVLLVLLDLLAFKGRMI